jgi:hypothetical protein
MDYEHWPERERFVALDQAIKVHAEYERERTMGTRKPNSLIERGDSVNRPLADLPAVALVRNGPVDRPRAHFQVVHPSPA